MEVFYTGKFTWYLEENLKDIIRLILFSDKGREEWIRRDETYIYIFKMIKKEVSIREFSVFCSKVGLTFYNRVIVFDKQGNKYTYVYKKTLKRMLRKNYYKRNNLEIPENDLLAVDFSKWNWYTTGMLLRVRELCIKYNNKEKLKIARNSRGYYKWSYRVNQWMPCNGFKFSIESIRQVFIEDCYGYIHIYNYENGELEEYIKKGEDL